MTEAEQRELFTLVAAAFDSKGTSEFEKRVEGIAKQWRDRYDFALVRRRDRARLRRAA